MIKVALFNFFIISSLSFFSSWLLIEGVIFLCRIRCLRVKVLLLILPFIKLFYDLFHWDTSKHIALSGFFPHMAIENTRVMNLHLEQGGIFLKIRAIFEYTSGMAFTLADGLYGLLSQKIVTLLLVVTCLYYAFSLTCKLYALIKEFFFIRRLVVCAKRISFGGIRGNLELLVGKDYFGSPFVFGIYKRKVVVPANFFIKYSKKEQQAVIAHEIAHIRHKDVLINAVVIITNILFAHIPMKFLAKKISFFQECLSDQKAMDQGVSKRVLFKAILKNCTHQSNIVAAFHTKRNLMERMLHMKNYTKSTIRFYHFVLYAIALHIAFGVFLAKLWTI